MKNRIGFFGGCFNPVTNAHVDLIKDVIKKENLSKVYFVPMGDLYEKNDLIPLKNRMDMLKLAFDNDEKVDVLNISNVDKKTSAIDSFKIIDETFPDNDRFFIMGSDNYNNIKNWKNYDELNKYNYIVLDRENGNTKDISSSCVRKKVLFNEEFESLVPNKVAKYIKENNLYKREEHK